MGSQTRSIFHGYICAWQCFARRHNTAKSLIMSLHSMRKGYLRIAKWQTIADKGKRNFDVRYVCKLNEIGGHTFMIMSNILLLIYSS